MSEYPTNFRVALFKKFPSASAFAMHPFHAMLRQSAWVGRKDYFIATPLPEPIKSLDRILASTLLGLTPRSYTDMADREVAYDLTRGSYDLIIPDGKSLVRQAVLRLPKYGVVMFHYGPLPKMRGMNTVEWCLCFSLPVETTLYLYDTGIDTGDVLLTAQVSGGPFRSIRHARARARLTSIKLMQEFFDDPPTALSRRRSQHAGEGRTFYEMRPELKQAIEARLTSRRDGTLLRLGSSDELTSLRAISAPEKIGVALIQTLQMLKVPDQELRSDPASQVITALHFLRKRREGAAAHALVEALDWILHHPLTGEVLMLLIGNELLALEQEKEFPKLTKSRAAAGLMKTFSELLSKPSD